jgi:hypothetical protein
MTGPAISLRMSSNEKGSGRDVALMKEVDRHPDRWNFDFAEIGLDLLFSLGDREIRWELKMPPDLFQSWQSGHLASQLTQAASYDHPAMIAVLGANMDVLEAIPKITKQSGLLTSETREGFEAAIERWEAACFAAGFPVHYFHGGLDNSMRRICRWSRGYLLGEVELPRPKAESWLEYALCGLPGVGPVTAKTMIENKIVPWVARDRDGEMWSVSIDELMELPGIGKKTATKIMEAIR